MDVKKIIQDEKLQNILKPEKGNSQFKITLRFEKFFSKKFDQALSLAKKNKYFVTEGEEDNTKFYVTFFPENFDQLHEMFELIKNREETKVFINNKSIPFAQDLWLFLAWFYRIK